MTKHSVSMGWFYLGTLAGMIAGGQTQVFVSDLTVIIRDSLEE